MLVTDLRHFLQLSDEVPAPARRLAAQLYDLVRAASAGDVGTAWVSALPCRRRPGHRRCGGRMSLLRAQVDGPIAWECTRCGAAGHISNWEHSPCDLRRRPPAPNNPVHQVPIPDEVATVLRTIYVLDNDCERVVFGAYLDGTDIVLRASDDDLDELIGYVAAEANQEPNRRRRQRLDAAFTVLTDAADTSRTLVPVPPTPSSKPAEVPPRAQPAVTGLPELDIARVQRWCAARVPEHARHQVRMECEVTPRHLTIIERRAPWREEFGPEWTSLPIARLRYTRTTNTWTLYWRDSNLRFHIYEPLAPSAHLDPLLAELDQDPTHIFWG